MVETRHRVISDGDIAHCKAFAEKCYETNKDEYAKRGQTDKFKIIEDIKMGKIAEIAVYFYLTKEKGLQCSQPDFIIYPASSKSYSADLSVRTKSGDLYDLHIKSQTFAQASSFGASWMFQKRDSLTYAPKDNDIIYFCTIDNNTVYIKHIFMAKNLVNCYGLPKVDNYKGNKLAMYSEGLSALSQKQKEGL